MTVCVYMEGKGRMLSKKNIYIYIYIPITFLDPLSLCLPCGIVCLYKELSTIKPGLIFFWNSSF
jgi:hypothetical protein